MFKRILTAGFVMSQLGLLALPINGMAEEAEKPTAEASVGFYSQYVWRGEAWSKDSMVIQPSLSIGYKGFGFNLWGNLDTDNYTNADGYSNLSETDLTLSYDGGYGKLSYGIGYIYYELQGNPDPQEVYLSLGYDTLLSPSLTVYREITGTQGWTYANFGISHSFAMTDSLGLDLGASVGYFDNDGTVSDFHDGLLSASVSIPLNEYISISPELYYSFALSNESETYLKTVSGYTDNDDSHFYGGVSISMAF